LWAEAGDLGLALRRRWGSPKTMDLVIATCALVHSLELLMADAGFAVMKEVGVPWPLTRTLTRRRRGLG
jgi:predicted nucleic acid-binding protein